MDRRIKRMAWGTSAIAGLLALATGGMSMAPPDSPVRMSALRVEGLSGLPVRASEGKAVGRVVTVTVDSEGRTRYLRIALDEGGEATVASFRAWLDADGQGIALMLPEDLLLARAEAEAAPTQPSA